MLKNIISPVQAWLLSKGQCAGCGTPLVKGKKQKHKDGMQKVICKCGRIYIHEPKSDKYRRALFEEV